MTQSYWWLVFTHPRGSFIYSEEKLFDSKHFKLSFLMCLRCIMNHSEVVQVRRNKPTGVCSFYNFPPDFAELRLVSASVRVDVIIIPFSAHIRLNLIPALDDSTDLWFSRLATLSVMWFFFFAISRWILNLARRSLRAQVWIFTPTLFIFLAPSMHPELHTAL